MDEALVRKLRVPAEGRVALLLAPEGYAEKIGRTEGETRLDEAAEPGSYDFVQLFASGVADVESLAPAAIRAAKPDGLLWLCYPKGTSKLKTDLNRDKGWDVVTAAGWEGVSLISVDDTWSAMRFRPRGEESRPRPTPAERRQAKPAASAEPLPVPEDLERALREHPAAEAVFAKLAPSHRKEYIQWVTEAKRAETRASRVEKTVDKLAQGLKRPSDKA